MTRDLLELIAAVGDNASDERNLKLQTMASILELMDLASPILRLPLLDERPHSLLLIFRRKT